ncbi:MAG: trypsin-like peptidase domain-containing protein [Chloroflexi bacterium]|nr:trypsin-like peptidase domain-containing protein [Chloroflexota bacterium]
MFDSASSTPMLARKLAGVALPAIAVLSLFVAVACGDDPPPEPSPTPLPTYTPVPPTPTALPESDTASKTTADGVMNPITGALPSLADVVEEIEPWVVSVTTERFVRGFFSTFRDEGAGSGFIVRPDGYIATNEHVIRGANEIEVQLHNGESYPATVVGKDIVTDIAILKIDADGLPFATLSDTASLRVGDWVMTLGNALDLKGGPTATLGIVSGLGRSIKTEQGQQFFNLIQTDATINTGNSGGPLVDMNGTVIGINQAVLAEARFGFAINASIARTVIDGLIEDGMVSRPEIGIKGDDLTPAIARSFNLSVTEGVVVTAIATNGPAFDAGLRVGHIITKLDDIPTPDLATFLPRFWGYETGDEIVIEYVDGDSTKVTTVTVASDPTQQ